MTGPILLLKYAMVERDGIGVEPIKTRVVDSTHGGAGP